MKSCEDHFPNILKVLVFYGRNLFTEDSSVVASLLRAFILILGKYPAERKRSESHISHRMTETVPELMSFLFRVLDEKLDNEYV